MRRLEAGARLGLAGWAMVITMARAVRYPNDFAEAHWLLDYRFGFIKRGLAGSALTLFTWTGLARPTADTVAALSFAVFGLLAIALLAMTARLLNTDGPHSTSFAAAAVFATSPFVVMTAHFMGYMDHLVLLAAFGAAWLALRGRAWPAGVIAALGVLVHESFLLVGFPLVLLASHLGPARPRGPARRILPFLLPLAAAGALGMAEVLVLDPATLRQQLVARLTAFPFIERDINMFLPEWLTTSALSNLRSQAHAFWRHLADVNLLRLMLPPAAFIILVASASAPAGARARRAIMATAAASAPLLMHAMAWDTARIWTYTTVVAFGCAWLFSASNAIEPVRDQRWLLALAVPILLANILGRSPLMDGEVERFSTAMRLFLYAPFIAGAALAIGEGLRGPRAGPS
jgi:hypothetical protein